MSSTQSPCPSLSLHLPPATTGGPSRDRSGSTCKDTGGYRPTRVGTPDGLRAPGPEPTRPPGRRQDRRLSREVEVEPSDGSVVRLLSPTTDTSHRLTRSFRSPWVSSPLSRPLQPPNPPTPSVPRNRPRSFNPTGPGSFPDTTSHPRHPSTPFPGQTPDPSKRPQSWWGPSLSSHPSTRETGVVRRPLSLVPSLPTNLT